MPAGFANEQTAGEIYARGSMTDFAGLQQQQNKQQERSKRLADATEQANRAQIQQKQAQLQLDAFDAQSNLRRLSTQQQINDLSATQIQLQDQLAPGLIREAELRDRITLATQENLNLTKATLQAQQASLPTSRALADLNYEETLATQRATVAAVDQAQGRTPSFDIQEQVDKIIAAEYAKLGGAELAATQAQRGVDLAQRAQQDDQLKKQLAAIPFQQQLQGTQAENIPMQAGARVVQSQADALQRSLQAAELVAGPDRVRTETALTNARIAEIDATRTVLSAQAQEAGLPPIANQITIAGNVQFDDALIRRITDAASSGTLDAIVKAKSLFGERAGRTRLLSHQSRRNGSARSMSVTRLPLPTPAGNRS